jgi:alpha-amylase
MSRRRVSVVLLAVALAAAAASTPVGTVGAAPSGPLVGKHSLRAPVTDETFYFVMADRFENGDTDNDRGGISGGVDQHGFGPTNKGFYQGGDLKGLLDRIDYIQDLGTTSIWLTPSFENKAVQLEDGPSAGYYG